MLRSLAILVLVPAMAFAQPGDYQKRATRAATVKATLESFRIPTLDGSWHLCGPFDNREAVGFETAYPPEKEFNLAATYAGKLGAKAAWKEVDFTCGSKFNFLPHFPDDRNDTVAYLVHEFEASEAVSLTVSFGADDTLDVFFNGKRLIHEKHERAAESDQFRTTLEIRAGKNTLLVKVGQFGGQWAVIVEPNLPESLSAMVRKQLERDFPRETNPVVSGQAEANHYRVQTIPLPADCVMEVGGLAFRPDGKLLACTRRGEIWLIEKPELASAAETRFKRFTAGLHEPLGMWVENNNSIYVIQRPELSKITDRDGDGTADHFQTVCDRFGVSGDYHEYAFGPARAKDGSFFVTLNVGFGGGHQSKVPFRGWCVNIDPKTGSMEPWAYGLRSPNGVNFSPEGDLFYADNQGEWVATNKLHHIRRGDNFGHQASLVWLNQSPFKDRPSRIPSGMKYDGSDGKFPPHDPPAIWFPYGRMGQSASEPVWDTSGGKFGPFAGQCFVGDQTRSMVMRVALEKVNGIYQGACFPFRSGLQCGVNRLVFGPDGSLYVGQTNRGWGSTGGKPYGLERISFTGDLPLEIKTITMTKGGFHLTFTKPLKAVPELALKSWTYIYHSTYGCPDTDVRPEPYKDVVLSNDGLVLSVSVPSIRRGRVFDFRITNAQSTEGQSLLHPDAYYTVNEVLK